MSSFKKFTIQKEINVLNWILHMVDINSHKTLILWWLRVENSRVRMSRTPVSIFEKKRNALTYVSMRSLIIQICFDNVLPRIFQIFFKKGGPYSLFQNDIIPFHSIPFKVYIRKNPAKKQTTTTYKKWK